MLAKELRNGPAGFHGLDHPLGPYATFLGQKMAKYGEASGKQKMERAAARTCAQEERERESKPEPTTGLVKYYSIGLVRPSRSLVDIRCTRSNGYSNLFGILFGFFLLRGSESKGTKSISDQSGT